MVKSFFPKIKKTILSKAFISRVENKEFNVFTPLLVLERVSKWKEVEIRDAIEEFYVKNSELLTTKDIKRRFKELNVNDEKVLKDLEKNGVKPEDALLVLISSVFEFDSPVTFNRKHLKNKEQVINRIMKNNKLKEVDIVEPNEI